MRLATYEVYKFDELEASAKEKARNWYRQHMEWFWCDESLDSIKAFCKEFDVTLKDYEVDAWTYYFRTDAETSNFRGLKLKHVPRDRKELTGYCLDYTLWYTFHDEFKRTGNALLAFNEAIEAGFIAWRNDLEYQYSDEYIDDFIIGNDYEFYANGERI
jgi:hypothetical protein